MRKFLGLALLGLLSLLAIKAKSEPAQAEAPADKTQKTNYWLPIIGGAVLGIGLALWLRRKK